MSRIFKSLAMLVSLLLTGCASGGQTNPVSLPLATNQPTFIFIYTDN